MHGTRLFLFLGTLLAAFATQADTVTLRSDYWFPYNGDPENPRRPGYTIEIIRMALEEGGHKLDYQTLSWDESIEKVRSGKFDCVVGAYKSDAPDLIFTEEPLGTDTTAFYSLTGEDNSWKYEGTASLANKRIGITESYSYGDELDAYFKSSEGKKHVQEVGGDEPLDKLIQLLLDKKIDLVVESPTVFRARIRQLGMKFFFNESILPNKQEPLYFACSPNKESSRTYTQLISKKIRELRKSGELGTLLSKYGLKDWVPAK